MFLVARDEAVLRERLAGWRAAGREVAGVGADVSTSDGRINAIYGVTMFELVTGQRPFETGDVTYHHRHTPAPDPRSLGIEMPEALATLILQMMAKAPADRPASAEQVSQRLRAILGAQRK